MDFKEVYRWVDKNKEQAITLALNAQAADASGDQEKGKLAGNALWSFFCALWAELEAIGQAGEYDHIADLLSSDVRCEAGYNIHGFAH